MNRFSIMHVSSVSKFKFYSLAQLPEDYITLVEPSLIFPFWQFNAFDQVMNYFIRLQITYNSVGYNQVLLLYGWSLWHYFMLLKRIHFFSYGFAFSKIQVFTCPISACLKYPYSFFPSILLSSFLGVFVFKLLLILLAALISLCISVFIKSMYWHTYVITNYGKWLSSFFRRISHHLCIVNNFHELYSICLSCSLINFKNSPECLIRGTALVFIPLMRLLQVTLISIIFLVLLRYYFFFYWLFFLFDSIHPQNVPVLLIFLLSKY